MNIRMLGLCLVFALLTGCCVHVHLHLPGGHKEPSTIIEVKPPIPAEEERANTTIIEMEERP